MRGDTIAPAFLVLSEVRRARSSLCAAITAITVQFYDSSLSLSRSQCNDNQISDWKDMDQLSGAKQLQTVYLERNPVAKDVNYRRKLKLALPSLTQIDATLTR